jgi:hypothetical protein
MKIGGDTTTKDLLTNSDGNTVTSDSPKIATGTPSLAAGYYQITVTLTKDSGATKAVKTEIAHITADLTTELDYGFEAADYFSAYTISGTISVGIGTPDLSAAVVTLKSSRGTDIGTVTPPNAGGEYSIAGVPASGDYTLAVSLAGYDTKSLTVTGTTSALTGQNFVLSRLFMVTSSADAGDNTLRWALTQATAATSTSVPDIVRVDAAVAASGITLASAYPQINGKKLEIQGEQRYHFGERCPADSANYWHRQHGYH